MYEWRALAGSPIAWTGSLPISSFKRFGPAGGPSARSAPICADLRFETPAAHGCRMVVVAIDALAHLITGRPHLFAEQDVGTRRDQTREEMDAAATEQLLDALGECRGAATGASIRVKVQGRDL